VRYIFSDASIEVDPPGHLVTGLRYQGGVHIEDTKMESERWTERTRIVLLQSNDPEHIQAMQEVITCLLEQCSEALLGGIFGLAEYVVSWGVLVDQIRELRQEPVKVLYLLRDAGPLLVDDDWEPEEIIRWARRKIECG
jgi:hypothetical protein